MVFAKTFGPDSEDKAKSESLKKILPEAYAPNPQLGLSESDDSVSVEYLSSRYLSLLESHDDAEFLGAHPITLTHSFLFEKMNGKWKYLDTGPVSTSKECITKVGSLLRSELISQKASRVVDGEYTDEELVKGASWDLQFNGAQALYDLNTVGAYPDLFEVSLNRKELGACLLTAPE